jgi:hypothetical protein
MIFTISVQQDLERAICPEKITKSQMLPGAIIVLVILLGHFSRIFIREVFLIL